MLLVNNKNTTPKEFIELFQLHEMLGLEKGFEKFEITKPKEFEYLPEVLKDDRFGMFGKKAAASRFIPREYRTATPNGESVEVRYTTMLPRPNPKTGAMEYPVARKENWQFSLFLDKGKEDLFLFMLCNPECATAPISDSNQAYYRLRSKEKEIAKNYAREEKLDEVYAYIKSLTGQALVIKALGAGIENAFFIYDSEGEASLRLELRKRAAENPYNFLEILTQDGGEVGGRIKYAVSKGMILKNSTGIPDMYVWQFADGQDICKVQGTVDAMRQLHDTVVYNSELYQKICKMVDKEMTPEVLDQLKKRNADTSEKISLLIDAELLTYDMATKCVYWVLKGEIVEGEIMKAKKAWKSELVELFDKDKSLNDLLNEKYAQAKKKALV